MTDKRRKVETAPDAKKGLLDLPLEIIKHEISSYMLLAELYKLIKTNSLLYSLLDEVWQNIRYFPVVRSYLNVTTVVLIPFKKERMKIFLDLDFGCKAGNRNHSNTYKVCTGEGGFYKHKEFNTLLKIFNEKKLKIFNAQIFKIFRLDINVDTLLHKLKRTQGTRDEGARRMDWIEHMDGNSLTVDTIRICIWSPKKLNDLSLYERTSYFLDLWIKDIIDFFDSWIKDLIDKREREGKRKEEIRKLMRKTSKLL